MYRFSRLAPRPALFVAVAALAVAMPSRAQVARAGLAVQNLRCEYLENPTGIDVLQPRLAWGLRSEERGQKQSAYRVLVASVPERLAADLGDLWDSGKVVSDQTIQVAYAGSALNTRQRCFWKVRAWDRNGQPTPWSGAATWSMGLLQPADWKAEWIAYRPPAPVISPHNGYHSALALTADTNKWVSVDLGAARAVGGVDLFPSRPYDRTPDTPGFLFPARFKVETALKTDFSDAVPAVDRTAADVPNPGTNALTYAFAPRSARYVRLTATRLTGCDTKNYAFALAELRVHSGGTNVAEKAAVTASDAIEAGGWAKMKLTDGRLFPDKGTPQVTPPATLLRKEFVLSGPIKHAAVSVTGLGLYELRINGRRVGDHVLAPEWTRYGKRIQYQTYDVTELLRDGANALGAQLCAGWWAGPLVIRPLWPAPQYCLRMRLDIERADGTLQSVVSDGTWQATDAGPIRRSEIYYGEDYDATREQPGWDSPGFTAAGWIPALTLPCPDGAEGTVLVAQPNEPVRVVEELHPVRLTEPQPGVYVFDLGQNIAGWCRLKAAAPAGTVITLRHGEMLNDDGTVYTDNLRGLAQLNVYTWRGGEAELEPHFTYHGFRYVQVDGLPGRPAEDAVIGRVFHSDATAAGKFSCSDEMLNTIMRCSDWTQRANLMSVPTDCPQRGERLGWAGDIQIFSQTAIFNRDMAAFFSKWLYDVRDSQYGDGTFSDLAPIPERSGGIGGAPGWADAGTIIPWRVYVNYADTRMLAGHFDAARRWVDLIHRRNPGLLWLQSRGCDHGDWLNGDTMLLDGYPKGVGAVPKEVLATAFFAHSAEIVSKMARALGREGEAERYAKLHEGIKAAFQRAFVSADGRITGDTQAGYALALDFGLVDGPLRSKAMASLLEAIKTYKGHPSTGIQSTHRMLLALSRNGQHADACRLASLRTVPSWAYMVEMGATTIWERWDGYVKGRGFQNGGMNSFSHCAFGAIGEWVWRMLAGINPDETQAGYKHVIVRPRPGGGLTWVKSRYDSIRGPIVSEWTLAKGVFSLVVALPPNTTAAVFVPAKDAVTVTEGGLPAGQAKGVSFLRMEEGCAVYAVESGRYTFASDSAQTEY